jgi:hypothetical protein
MAITRAGGSYGQRNSELGSGLTDKPQNKLKGVGLEVYTEMRT